MSISLFRVAQGIEIELDDLSTAAAILVGIGEPGGDGAEQDGAPIGSTYHRTDAQPDSLQYYVKISTGANSSADWQPQASKNYVDNAIAGLSWREPARVMDQTSYADNTAFPTTGTIDGVALSDGDRVLFSDAGTSPDNVYIWDAGGTSWTEDSRAVMDGDALLILEGTSADEHYTYTGTEWIQIGSSENTEEIDFIRAFVGKESLGAEMPNYTSTDNIVQNSSLEAAIGVLDDSIGERTYTALNITSGNDVAVSLEDLNTAIGDRGYVSPNIIVANEAVSASLTSLDTAIGDRTYTAGNVLTDSETVTASLDSLSVAVGDRTYTAGNVVVDGETVTASIEKLSVSVGDRTYTEDNIVVDGETVSSSLDSIDIAIGDRTYSEGNVVTTGETITASIEALDVEIGQLDNQTQESTGTNVNATSGEVVDTIPVSEATEIKWLVQVRDAGTPGNRRGIEVHALNDGGTMVDHTEYAILKLGSAIAGFKLDVAINAGNMELILTVPTISVDYVVKRVSYSSF